VHNAGVVVGNGEGVHLVTAVSKEVQVGGVDHVLPDDPDVAVSVRPSLLVPEPDGVSQLVDQDTFVCTVWLPADTDRELLVPSLLSNVRPAPAPLNIMCNIMLSMQYQFSLIIRAFTMS
jgi:hypothetical protein